VLERVDEHSKKGTRMDTFEAIKQRRRVVNFTDRPIEHATMTQILEAARWAPSGGNLQRWRFIVVMDPHTKKLIGDVSPGLFGKPAAIVVICMEKRSRRNQWNTWIEACEAGISAQTIALSAFALGIGSCMILSFAKEGVEGILGLPEEIEPMLLVSLGYYEQLPEPPARLPLDAIAFEEQYGRGWRL
jgi:nitroreductase